MDLKEYVASIPNYPKEGILFRDVTPIISDAEAFKYSIDQLAAYCEKVGANFIIGPESRGFVFGCPVAYKLGLGFGLVRKPGKLPRKTVKCEYSLEYGTGTLEMTEDTIKPGMKVVIIDDLLATGGTVDACAKLVKQCGGEVVGSAFIIELVDLKGREFLKDIDVCSLIEYEGE